ncbi:hypothetical protein NPIL_601511 [Nephila pilipes]|uniref:Uncharacterized protein n=1 Tax=Nephila pilipes TaxID=299642 RepID=A0A8X6UIK0_NEPPI|nr:hypothetical protein NPIL_601511 [Nephila pilipes]
MCPSVRWKGQINGQIGSFFLDQPNETTLVSSDFYRLGRKMSSPSQALRVPARCEQMGKVPSTAARIV